MRVLMIDVNYKNSSTGKIVYDLYNSLNKDGHTAAVCYGRGKKHDDVNVLKFGIDLETVFHAFMTRVTGLTGCFSFFSTFRLIRFIKRFNPDVVHIHELHAYFVNSTPLIQYLKKNNIKTVWTFHCEFMYTGKCGHAYDCENWKTECHKCPQLKVYPKSLYFDFTRQMHRRKKNLFRDFSNLTIVSPSKWLADRIEHSFLNQHDIRTISNGIDTESIFYYREYQHLKEKHDITDEKIVLSVGSSIMSESKGGEWVVELARKFMNENVRFIIIGVEDVEKEYGNNIITIGKTCNQMELAEYYSMADVSLITSKKETFSLVCAESLACGTPIIGFEAGAPSEVAPNGYGLFVDYGDIESLTRELMCFIDDLQEYKTQLECIEYAKLNFSKENMFREYLGLYQEK